MARLFMQRYSINRLLNCWMMVRCSMGQEKPRNGRAPATVHEPSRTEKIRENSLAVVECGGKSARHRFRTSLDFQIVIGASKWYDSRKLCTRRLHLFAMPFWRARRPAAAGFNGRGCCGWCPLAPHTAALRAPIDSWSQFILEKKGVSHEPSRSVLRATRSYRLRCVNDRLRVRRRPKAVSRGLATALQDGKRGRTVHGSNASKYIRKRFSRNRADSRSLHYLR